MKSGPHSDRRVDDDLYIFIGLVPRRRGQLAHRKCAGDDGNRSAGHGQDGLRAFEPALLIERTRSRFGSVHAVVSRQSEIRPPIKR